MRVTFLPAVCNRSSNLEERVVGAHDVLERFLDGRVVGLPCGSSSMEEVIDSPSEERVVRVGDVGRIGWQ